MKRPLFWSNTVVQCVEKIKWQHSPQSCQSNIQFIWLSVIPTIHCDLLSIQQSCHTQPPLPPLTPCRLICWVVLTSVQCYTEAVHFHTYIPFLLDERGSLAWPKDNWGAKEFTEILLDEVCTCSSCPLSITRNCPATLRTSKWPQSSTSSNLVNTCPEQQQMHPQSL